MTQPAAAGPDVADAETQPEHAAPVSGVTTAAGWQQAPRGAGMPAAPGDPREAVGLVQQGLGNHATRRLAEAGPGAWPSKEATPGSRQQIAAARRLLGELGPPRLKAGRATEPDAALRQSLLVADDIGDPGLGRMSVGAFLDAVEVRVAEVAAAELGPVFEVVGCPWLAHWIAYYRGRTPADVENALRRYAPAAANAETAEQYVELVAGRVREGISVWRTTGETPEPPVDSPGAPRALQPAFRLRDGESAPHGTADALGGSLGSGDPIDGQVAGAAGAAYGADLSGVRVHTGGPAARVVSALGARALTVGRDIAFAPGSYAPGTPVGDALIAHELAHVVQQTAHGSGSAAATADTAALEKDADRAAGDAIVGQPGGTRAPALASSPFRPQSCTPPAGESETTIFDAEAEALARRYGVALHTEPEVDAPRAPVGFTPRFWATSPPSVGPRGQYPSYTVRNWYVMEPGGSEFRRRNGPEPGRRFAVEMDRAGEWVVLAEFRIEGKRVFLPRRFTIVAGDEILSEAFQAAVPSGYVNWRTLLNQERLQRAGGVDLDQAMVAGAYITNEGPDAANPAEVGWGLDSFTYAVHPNPKAPPDRRPVMFRWWAIPRETEMNRWSSRTDLGRRTEYQGEFAFYLGEGARRRFRREGPAKIAIVCECLDADGKLVDTATYQQVTMGKYGLAAVRQIENLMREGTANYRKIKPGTARGVKAVHLDTRRGTTAGLTMFIGPSAADESKTMLVDLTPGAEYVEHEGASVEAAIKHLDDNNSYGQGQLWIRVEGTPPIEKKLTTTGESDLQAAASRTGIGSMVMIGLGIVAAASGVGAVAAPYLIVGGLGLGGVSGGISIADELRKAKPSHLKIAIDVAGIVGALAGAGGMAQAIRMGSVELAMATAAGRFAVYVGFTFDVTGGVLIAVDTADKIEEIRNSRMSDDEKIDAIHRLVLQLVVTGGMIAFGARDISAARSRVGVFLGKERVGRLSTQAVYTLQALDDEVLRLLQRVPVGEFEPVVAALSRDPRRAAALSRAFGSKFVDEVRANPSRSLDEVAEVLGAKAAGAPVGGTRGPDVYPLDPAKGLRGKSRGARERFERAVNKARKDRLHGAQIDKGSLKFTDDGAELEMSVGGERLRITVELKKTSELTGGAHTATGGAGPGRIVQLEPPKAGVPHWTGRVELDDALMQDSAVFVLGHELDEIADFVVTKGASNIAELGSQMEAGLFVTWAQRGSKTPPIMTSHDRANARELLGVAADLRTIEIKVQQAPTDAALKARLANRRATLDTLMKNMGLFDPEHIELKLAALRKSLAEMEPHPKGVLATPPAPFEAIVDAVQRGVTTAEFTTSAAAATGGRTVLTPELVAHVVRPKPQTRGDFLSSGLHGGHHDAAVQEFLLSNPEYVLVKRHEVTSGGVTYRSYDQYRWNAESAKKPPPLKTSPDRPGGPGPIDPLWEKNPKFPKTTFDDPARFLATADSIIKAWQDGLTPADLAKPMTGPRVIGTDPRLLIQFDYQPAPGGKPGVWNIKSIAIDEKWIAAAEKAAATPTPPPTGGQNP